MVTASQSVSLLSLLPGVHAFLCPPLGWELWCASSQQNKAEVMGCLAHGYITLNRLSLLAR